MRPLRHLLVLALASTLPILRAADALGMPLATARTILRAEDDRRWSSELETIIRDGDIGPRMRAMVAAGRIGDARAIPCLVDVMKGNAVPSIRNVAIFALGEIESPLAAAPLLTELNRGNDVVDRSGSPGGRILESLGKIAASEATAPELKSEIGKAILLRLGTPLPNYSIPWTNPGEFETRSGGRPPSSSPERATDVSLRLIAVLRAKPEGGTPAVAAYIRDIDPAVRAAALNVIARLRAAEHLDTVRSLAETDPDPLVRANATRVLGAAKDKPSLPLLIGKLLKDPDVRVRVSAIRALAAIEDPSAAKPLMDYALPLFNAYKAKKSTRTPHPEEANEIFEVSTALGVLLKGTNSAEAVGGLRQFRAAEPAAPEIEIAFARIAPAIYLKENPFPKTADQTALGELFADWKAIAAQAEGLGAIATAASEPTTEAGKALQTEARNYLRAWLAHAALPVKASPAVLSALGEAAPEGLDTILRIQLGRNDVDLRAVAATLMAELPPSDVNLRALLIALTATARDERNDAALAIIDAIGKQKSRDGNDAIKVLLRSPDYLVRTKTAAILRAGGATDVPADLGRTTSRIPDALYDRALARIGKKVEARVETAKGAFTIELAPAEAPLTVDNFIDLARRGYFNGLTFHRVVSNFVIQGGDPRGDGNGGPGYQIRCEVNELPFDRGAVGMALSGKDTGGSQWFVTHAPQPHLDGGYTVFGKVTSGMEAVDLIARGDIIQRITITER